jgi:hypothetical protein
MRSLPFWIEWEVIFMFTSMNAVPKTGQVDFPVPAGGSFSGLNLVWARGSQGFVLRYERAFLTAHEDAGAELETKAVRRSATRMECTCCANDAGRVVHTTFSPRKKRWL